MRVALVVVAMFASACAEASDDDSEAQSSDGGVSTDDTTRGSSGSATERDDEATVPYDCVPEYDCDPEPPDTGDPHADCVARVNQFRACACMNPLERNFEAESCADQQAEYDSINRTPSHAAFRDRICSPGGGAQNECPGWGSVEDSIVGCIRQMYYEGPPEDDPCEGQCYQDHGHFLNMTDPEMRSVACGFFEADDGVWAIQNFFR